MKPKRKQKIGPEALAALSLAPFVHDPMGFVEAQYPWGQGELEGKTARDRAWQVEVLEAIGEHLRNPETRYQPFLGAIVSGHGVGKSTIVSWLVHWATTTMVDARCVVTANTETQLRTKTWPELSKWTHRLAVRDLFRLEGMRFSIRDDAHEKNWRADALPWSESNPEAFAGLHNEGKRIVVIMDEASGIHDKIWEVVQGALTDENTEIIWLVLGNPTRPQGEFFNCFNSRTAHRWRRWQVDSRTVPGTNKAELARWVEMYGEDSDFVRVRVRGLFPRTGAQQLIGYETVTEAQQRDVAPRISDPLVLGVDVARFGDDQTVIYPRKGDVAGLHGGPWKFRELDNEGVARAVAAKIKELKPNYVMIDGGGPGGGVIDILRAWGYDVIEVQFGGRAANPDYANKRAEIWCLMRDWLKDGGMIPWSDAELARDLTNQTYGYREGRDNALLLTPKQVMKERDNLPSPDSADALACTFAVPVNPITEVSGRLGDVRTAETEYAGGWE